MLFFSFSFLQFDFDFLFCLQQLGCVLDFLADDIDTVLIRAPGQTATDNI